MRLDLPSNFRFYKQKSFESDKLKVANIAEVYEAQQKRSTRFLVSALQKLTKFPLNEMLVEDFHWYIRQLAITGYTKQSRSFQWTSKYGHKLVSEIDLLAFTVNELLPEFELPLGYRLPTMKDFYEIEEIDSIAKSWLYSQAQYIDAPTWEARIKSLTPDKLETIKQLQNLRFGVEEYAVVKDYEFDVDEWLDKCKKSKALLEDEKDFNNEYLNLKAEIEYWESIKASGSPAEVEPERVYFPISASLLLP